MHALSMFRGGRSVVAATAVTAILCSLSSPARADAFEVRGNDDGYVVRVKGIVQADARAFTQGGTNQFLVRSARPILDVDVGTFVGFRIAPELSPTPSLQDAYASLRFDKAIRLRLGKFKSPVGLERLQDEGDVELLERALPTAVAPNRDVGAQLHGELGPRLVTWAVGVFDGAEDGASVDASPRDKKDWAARVFARPFAATTIVALQRLGLGVAGTYGAHTGAPSPYKTSGLSTFFQFGKDVLAAGAHARLMPQASWYVGSVGAWCEWIRSSQTLADGKGRESTAVVTAWQVGAAWVLTGEDATDEGVTPRRAFEPRAGRFGALELVARVAQLRVGEGVFAAGLADPKVSAWRATAWAVGATWHLARRVKGLVNVERTTFVGGAASGDRRAELLIGARLQVAF
jgi:phosphate-selective porin OprO/OprP